MGSPGALLAPRGGWVQGNAEMADGRQRFTEPTIDRLRPPRSGRLELKDALTPGLVLRVTDRGTKTFSAVYKVAGEGA